MFISDYVQMRLRGRAEKIFSIVNFFLVAVLQLSEFGLLAFLLRLRILLIRQLFKHLDN